MKQIIYSLLLLVCVGCSKANEEEPPTYLQLSGPLFSYFYQTEPTAGPIVPLDTIYIGETYKVSLYPCSVGEGSEHIKAVTYYLNGVELEVTKSGAFAGSYTVTVEPGSYTLSCKPVFISEYIIWEVSEPRKVTVL